MMFNRMNPMDVDNSRYNYQEYLSNEGMDHLIYLKHRPSIFENENDLKILQKILVCIACGQPVTRVSEKIEVLGRHAHAFPYYGEMIPLGCFRNAPGCLGVESISKGYSWFRGYAWQIQVCRNCFSQLGWKYISDEDSFYGLMFRTLREENP